MSAYSEQIGNLTGRLAVFGESSITGRSTTAKAPVGTFADDGAGNEYLYVKAGGIIVAGAPVTVTAGVESVTQSADAKGFAGVAQAAFASGEYGYVLSRGRGLALIPSGTALGDPLTAGNGALAVDVAASLPTKVFTCQEAPLILSGTTQLKYVYGH